MTLDNIIIDDGLFDLCNKHYLIIYIFSLHVHSHMGKKLERFKIQDYYRKQFWEWVI